MSTPYRNVTYLRHEKLQSSEYRQRVNHLRERLPTAQRQLHRSDVSAVILFAGVDGAGKGDTANLLCRWLDPRRLVTRAFDRTTQEERERPGFWRFWRALPPSGSIGIFFSAWYHDPLLHRVYQHSGPNDLERQIQKILTFEQMLLAEGTLVLKFWLHLDKAAQRKRFEQLQADPEQSWRVTERDWQHWHMYDRFIESSSQIVEATSSGSARWTVIEGLDHRYSALAIGEALLGAIEERVGRPELEFDSNAATAAQTEFWALEPELDSNGSLFSELDMAQALRPKRYSRELRNHRAKLNSLHRRARQEKLATVVVFEGWDAGGKGGAIRRLTSALDVRDYEVISVGPPSDEARRYHYLWRFWRRLPAAGQLTIFDRSWYGRVLVERVEGFATSEQWKRAYDEIREFEAQLIEHGVVLVKLWLHITPEEQEQRFRERGQVPHKRWKLTAEDWRNRARWSEYEDAAHDMVRLTSTPSAPWTLVEANDKRFARIKVFRTVCAALEQVLQGNPRTWSTEANEGEAHEFQAFGPIRA